MHCGLKMHLTFLIVECNCARYLPDFVAAFPLLILSRSLLVVSSVKLDNFHHPGYFFFFSFVFT